MDEATLLAALQKADAAGNTQQAAVIAQQLAQLPTYERVAPGSIDSTPLRGTADPAAQAAQQQPMPAAVAPAAPAAAATPPAPAPAAPAAPAQRGMSLLDPDEAAQPAPGVVEQGHKPGGMSLLDPGDSAPAAGGTPADGNADGTTGDHWVDDANAVLQPLARTATLGAAPKVEAYIASKIYGVPYERALDAVNTRDEALRTQHNYLNAAGNVAGIGVGAVAAGPALAAAGLAPAEGAGAVANVLRTAGGGAAMSAGNSAIDSIGTGEDAGTVARNAAESGVVGAVAAPLIGGATNWLAGKLAPAVGAAAQYVGERLPGSTLSRASAPPSKAIQYLAGKLDISADDMQTALNQARAAGATPTIAGVVNSRDAGVIQRLSENNPTVAMSAQGAREAAKEVAPTEMAQAIEANIPQARPTLVGAQAPAAHANNPEWQTVADHEQSPQTLRDALDNNMTQIVNPIRNDPVTLPQSILRNRMVAHAAPRIGPIDAAGNEGVSTADKIDALVNQTPGAQPLNVGEVENIRQNLRRVSGGDGDNALGAGEAAEALRLQAGNIHPGYEQALSEYGDSAKYIEGFEHGAAGNPVTNAKTSSLRQALATPNGQDGHAAGVYIHARDQALEGADSALNVAKNLSRNTAGNSRLAAANPAGAAQVQATGRAVADRALALNNSTPSDVKINEEKGIGELAGAAIKGSAGLLHSAYHGTVRGLGQIFGNTTFSPVVQRQLAQQLHSTDAAVQSHAVDQLRAAGVTNRNLKSLSQRIGGVAGAKLNDIIFGN